MLSVYVCAHICPYITYKYIVLYLNQQQIMLLMLSRYHLSLTIYLIIFPFHTLPSTTITTGHDYRTIHTHSKIMTGDTKKFCVSMLCIPSHCLSIFFYPPFVSQHTHLGHAHTCTRTQIHTTMQLYFLKLMPTERTTLIVF